MNEIPLVAIQRFLSKVKIVGSCWEWQAYVQQNGYGQFGVNNKVEYSHRVSYTIFKGDIPLGLDLDHLCRNHKCVNPDHLESVTRKENSRRGENWQRNKTHCKRGHEYTPENTYVQPSSKARICKICKRITRKESKLRCKMRKRVMI